MTRALLSTFTARFPRCSFFQVRCAVAGYDAAVCFIEGLRLITHAVSLGGIDSLAQHPASLTHRPVIASARPSGGIVRLSIGLEHVDDLAADIMNALEGAGAPPPRVRAVPVPSPA